MLLTEGNPEAIHFNVNKKLAQLNKVIALFQSSEEDRDFRKQYLLKKYDPKFLDIMKKYSVKMDYISQKMKVIDEDTNSKYHNIYHSKYEALKKELKETVSQIHNNHNYQIDKHDKLISMALTTLSKIDYNLNKKFSPTIIEEKSIQSIEYIKQFQLDSEQQLKNDITEIHNKLSSQLKEHNESFKNRISELQTQHQHKIEKLNALYLTKSQQADKNKKDFLNQKREITQKVRKRYLTKGKTLVNQFLKDFNSMISSEKEKIFSLIKEINDDYSNSQKQISQHKHDIKKEINEMQKTSKSLSKKIDEKKIELKKPEDELANTLSNLTKSNKKEFDDKTNQFNINNQNLQNSLDNTKNQIKTEFEKTKEKLNEIANSKSSKYKEKENAYNDLLKSNSNKENQLKSDLSQNKKSHSSEIEDRKNKFIQEITETRQNHFGKLKEKQNEINQIKEKTEKQKKIFMDNINELRKQQVDFIKLSSKQKQDNINEFKQEIEDTSKLNDEELEKIKNEEEKKLNDIQKLNNENIEKHKKLLIEKKNQFISDIQNQSKQNLLNFEQDEKNRNQKVIDDFNNINQEKENNLNDELNSISTATSSEDQLKFKNLTEEFELLQKEKSDLIQKNSESKENLIDSHKKLTEDENKRHFSVLSNLSKSNNGRNTRQKVLNSLKKQIEQTIETRQIQGAKLKEDKEKMKERYELLQSTFISQKAEIIENYKNEEERLRREIEEAKQNMVILIDDKKKEMENLILEKKREIDNLSLYYLNEKDDLYHKNSKLLITFNEELRRLKDIYGRKSNDLNSKLSEESKNVLNNRSVLSSDYYERQKLIKLKIKDIKDNIKREKYILDDKAKRDLSQNLDKTAQYEKSVKFNLQKIKEDNEGLNGFLDEKIEVLRSRLNELKRKYIERKPREEEAKQIEILSLRLSKITNALNFASGDLKRCRSFTIDREKKVNPLFERPVIRTIPSTPR